MISMQFRTLEIFNSAQSRLITSFSFFPFMRTFTIMMFMLNLIFNFQSWLYTSSWKSTRSLVNWYLLQLVNFGYQLVDSTSCTWYSDWLDRWSLLGRLCIIVIIACARIIVHHVFGTFLSHHLLCSSLNELLHVLLFFRLLWCTFNRSISFLQASLTWWFHFSERLSDMITNFVLIDTKH